MSRLQGVSVLQYNPMSASSYDRLQDIAQTTTGFDFVCLTGTGARKYGTEEVVWRRAGKRWAVEAGWARSP
eukprot:8707868-Pyramimonas_sp.AAC.1